MVGRGAPGDPRGVHRGDRAREIAAPMIRSIEAEHRYASVDALYGAGHPPDSIVAGALAYRAARRGTLAASSSSEESDPRLRPATGGWPGSVAGSWAGGCGEGLVRGVGRMSDHDCFSDGADSYPRR